MVKVQHDWQSHSISELEDLTSNQQSTFSPNRAQTELPTSPTTEILQSARSTYVQGSLRDVSTQRLSKHTNITDKVSLSRYTFMGQREAYQFSPIDKTTGSYESFWRDHEHNSMPRTVELQSPNMVVPSLAPPLDILPRNTRPPDPVERQPPMVPTADRYQTGGQPVSSYPSTPSPKKASQMRTPSQQAAVEKDAVETLIFMSSPGNSAYHPTSATIGTPLRNEFASATTRIEPRGVFGPNHYVRGGVPSQELTTQRHPLSDADIDRMLDQMPEASSSDDEEVQQDPRLQITTSR